MSLLLRPKPPLSLGLAMAAVLIARAQRTASRARIVAAADDARRRLERDLHDGARQRLVSLGLELSYSEQRVHRFWAS
ncbi:histidine kinase [Dactylosporangium fulvum]|uniref:Histidine kinase n=1 Tax=Dactylosporangium fulvum TaxID=53359 RepID=A0ABY5VT25_9ACTN|nr:histidine kinase [Dactylosporangium fulvum]UWP78971.1 histidine kinase [Dactylosporangium fulvum]